MGLRASHVFLSDHWLHEVSNENPSGREAQNCAGQAGNEDVKGASVRLGCHSRSSDLSAQADLEHGKILERPLKSRCEISHATESIQFCGFAMKGLTGSAIALRKH